MLADLVLDTNVLMHADNKIEERQPAAYALLLALLAGRTPLRVDKGFSLDEAKNRSIICSEYLAHLTPLSLGYQVLTELAANGRVIPCDRKADQATARKINQLVRNKVDRTFLRVARNAEAQTLCSHDFDDYPRAKRATLASRIGVDVLDADEVRQAL